MAESKSAPKISYQHDDEREEHQLGVESEGVFVPFASVPDVVFNDRKQALSEAAGGEGDESGKGGAS